MAVGIRTIQQMRKIILGLGVQFANRSGGHKRSLITFDVCLRTTPPKFVEKLDMGIAAARERAKAQLNWF